MSNIKKVYLIRRNNDDWDDSEFSHTYYYIGPIENEFINYLIKHNFIDIDLPRYDIDNVKDQFRYIDCSDDDSDDDSKDDSEYDSEDDSEDYYSETYRKKYSKKHWNVLESFVRLCSFHYDLLKDYESIVNVINSPIEIQEPIINICSTFVTSDEEFSYGPVFKHIMNLSISELNELSDIIDKSVNKD